MPRPTASSLWLAELCPASHTQPQIRETSDAQAAGSDVHLFLERAPKIGRAAALAEMNDATRHLCEDLDPAALPNGLREASFVYDLNQRTGRMIGEGLGRGYPDAAGLACGTADVLSVESPAVWDYKTGWPVRAAESLQLVALGLYAARTYGWMRVPVWHLRLDGDRLRPDSIELGPVDLAAAHERIASIYRRYEDSLRTGEVDVRPGEHCTSCAAQPQCPATMALTSRAAVAAWVVPDNGFPVDLAAPAVAWEFLVRVEDLTKRLRSELKRQASIAPIPLPNGKELAIVPVEKTKIGPDALPLLRESIGQDQIDKCTSISKAALVKTTSKGVAAILTRKLKDAGVMKETTERHLREVKPATPAALAAVGEE